MSLTGKAAIVTGSSRSIGASIAIHLASEGAMVMVNYVGNADAAASVVSQINSKGPGKAASCKADVSTIAGAQTLLDAALKEFGRIDILVLNAGIMGSKVLADVDEAFFDNHMNINVKGPLFLVKAAAPLMTEGSRIIFLSTSLTVASTVLPNSLVYVASKGAIEQAARSLAKDLGTRGITVNVVSPGPVDTPLFRDGKPEQVINFIAGLNPFKRIGKPEEIAPVVAFLASPSAGWVSGQNIKVNGAFTV
ncbi:NAD(P)-binding protein [Gymnopus androsaceus JB14]|uniref:NAD(P)-binding protein n=1 Tax=Gymnopus androsaceus JB14 TaxID=1447944 RepID=A0A6A4HFS9_9AGAR|nr:NAD(P)-binding protein [Gymnopus androsaceus JB14]KAE9395875.1 NAD(P)-binding protein [Gymnopus androsaceus JB14]